MKKNANILVVDDDYKNQYVLGILLKEHNYNVSIASNADEAFSILDSQKHDLILLDIMMPDIDGFELCNLLKANTTLAKIPLIFISALHDTEHLLKGLNIGAADYITKPFDPRVVIARIRTQLNLKNKTETIEDLNKTLEKKVIQRTKQLQRANDELLMLDKAKSEFMQIISHEIRTPLNGIIGSLQLINQRCKHDNTINLLQILNSSIERLETFSLNAILISSLKINKYHLEISKVSISEIIDFIFSKVSNLLDEKKLLLKTKNDTHDDYILADKELFIKCFQIVLNNAIKYAKNETGIEINISDNKNHKSIEIVNVGEGFTQKALKNLFCLFSPGTQHINENMGIELALCKLIMDSHKGKIIAYNTNNGAAVKLSFNLNG